jgi:hypothetical protein
MNQHIAHPPEAETSELIATVDVCQLPAFRWPFLGVRAPDFVPEVQVALGRYLRKLQGSGTWSVLWVAPHPGDDLLPDHVFDVFGTRAKATGTVTTLTREEPVMG